MGKLLSLKKNVHLPWQMWKRRLALLLAVSLVANAGVIAPKAETVEDSVLMIWEVEELPESVRRQEVALGTKEEELDFPETLNVRAATDSDARRATASDTGEEGWRKVSVDWVFDSADNGQAMYREDQEGVYTFQAQLADKGYSAGLVTLPAVTVEVRETKEGEIIEEWDYNIELPSIQTSAPDLMTMSLEDGQVDLKGGNYINWIDRVDLPDYAVDFYNLLVEGSDNDGKEDVLIDDSSFLESNAYTLNSSSGGEPSVFNAFKVCTFTGLANELDNNERSYIFKSIRAALDAFDRDYPEVFWLNGRSWMKIGGRKRSANGITTYDYDFYFITHSHRDQDSGMVGFGSLKM